MWDKWKFNGQRRRKIHLSMQEILGVRKNQPSLRGSHLGTAVQAIKGRPFTEIGFGVLFHLWVNGDESDFINSALPLGGQ